MICLYYGQYGNMNTLESTLVSYVDIPDVHAIISNPKVSIVSYRSPGVSARYNLKCSH